MGVLSGLFGLLSALPGGTYPTRSASYESGWRDDYNGKSFSKFYGSRTVGGGMTPGSGYLVVTRRLLEARRGWYVAKDVYPMGSEGGANSTYLKGAAWVSFVGDADLFPNKDAAIRAGEAAMAGAAGLSGVWAPLPGERSTSTRTVNGLSFTVRGTNRKWYDRNFRPHDGWIVEVGLNGAYGSVAGFLGGAGTKPYVTDAAQATVYESAADAKRAVTNAIRTGVRV